jgi:glycosyltransferase involved in cell wall biosynthesis
MIWYLLTFIFLAGNYSFAEETHPKVCLNMIVKNESHVIERCLTSTLPIIDTWVIVDTGSTDGTQEIIRKFFKEKGMEGELHERPWVNFEHNRNEALQLAKGKGDYLLFMDADDYLQYEPDFKLPYLDKGCYIIVIHHGGTKYDRIHLIDNHMLWSWKGVLHESLVAPPGTTGGILQKVKNVYTGEGARSKDPAKFLKDAAILEAALAKEPNNDRYAFYLAQSYVDGKQLDKALKAYEKRVAMGGWDQEVYWSLYQIGNIKQGLELPPEEVIEAYMKAFKFRPTRVEPLYSMIRIYEGKKDFEAGYRLGKIGMTIPTSRDNLFVAAWIHEWGIPLELSVCAYWTGRYQECQELCLALLKKELLPEVKECVQNNLAFANQKLAEQVVEQVVSIEARKN